MADAGLHVVALARGPQRRAQVVRGQRLPDRADVVLSPSTVNSMVRLIAFGSTF